MSYISYLSYQLKRHSYSRRNSTCIVQAGQPSALRAPWTSIRLGAVAQQHAAGKDNYFNIFSRP
jgi:hypothetical protein